MPDFSIVKFTRGIVTAILMVGDQKRHVMTDSRNQTIAYALAVEGDHLLLGLATTYTEIILLLFIPFSGKLLVIEICSALISNDNQLEHFFCALYGAVHSLFHHPISAKRLTHPMTFKCCSAELLCLNKGESESHVNLKNNYGNDRRTVLIYCKDKCLVRKYYDLFHTLPNECLYLMPKYFTVTNIGIPIFG